MSDKKDIPWYKPNFQPLRTYFTSEGWSKDFDETGKDIRKISDSICDKIGIAGTLTASTTLHLGVPGGFLYWAATSGEPDIWAAAISGTVASALSIVSILKHMDTRSEIEIFEKTGELEINPTFPYQTGQTSYQTGQTPQTSTSQYPYSQVNEDFLRSGIPSDADPTKTIKLPLPQLEKEATEKGPEEKPRRLYERDEPLYKVTGIDEDGKILCECDDKTLH